jgi:predicted neuraminidase
MGIFRILKSMQLYSIPIVLLVSLLSCTPSPDKQVNKSIVDAIIFPLQNEHVHGPTIVELPNGDLLSAWFQGAGERWADDVRIMGSRLPRGDSAWSPPFLMADTPGFPDINPMMFLDTVNRLWLCWYPVLANQWESSIPMYRISESYSNPGAPEWSWQDFIFVKPGDKTERGIQPGDRFVEATRSQLNQYEEYFISELLLKIPEEERQGLILKWNSYKNKIDSLANGRNMISRGILQSDENKTWTRLGYPLSRRIGWQTKNKAINVGKRIIIPLYSDGLDCTLFAYTEDLGHTWDFSNPVMGGFGIQATIAKTTNGNLAAYLRDNGPPPNRMQRTISQDNGTTWTIARDTEIKYPGAGFDMTTLASGEWLMVYNDLEDERFNLTVSISDDNGKSWKWHRVLEHDDRGKLATASHYPAVIQGEDGLIHAVYSFHRRDQDQGPSKTIKYASFSTDWVKGDE